MDIKPGLPCVLLVAIACVTDVSRGINASSVRTKNHGDISDFKVFVQAFLTHLLSSTEFTDDEKNDIKTIIDTMELVAMAPRKRELPFDRRVKIFNLSVLSAIGQIVMFDANDEHQDVNRLSEKSKAVARALTAAFKMISRENKTNKLIADIGDMVNMYTKLEQQELDSTSHKNKLSDETNASPDKDGEFNTYNIDQNPLEDQSVVAPTLKVSEPGILVDNANYVENDSAFTRRHVEEFRKVLYSQLISNPWFRTAFNSATMPYDYNEFSASIASSMANAEEFRPVGELAFFLSLAKSSNEVKNMRTEDYAMSISEAITNLLDKHGLLRKGKIHEQAVTVAEVLTLRLQNKFGKQNQSNLAEETQQQGGSFPFVSLSKRNGKSAISKMNDQTEVNDFRRQSQRTLVSNCLYEELMSSTIFAEAFANGMPYEFSKSLLFSLALELGQTIFFERMEELEIYSLLEEGLKSLEEDPTTEDFAYMFSRKLTQILDKSGLLQQSNICSLILSEIYDLLLTKAPATQENSASKTLPLYDSDYQNVFLGSDIDDYVEERQTDMLNFYYDDDDDFIIGGHDNHIKSVFEKKLYQDLSSSELFRNAFPNTSSGTTAINYIQNSLREEPELKFVNFSPLISLIMQKLYSIPYAPTPEDSAYVFASEISAYLQNRRLLDKYKPEGQAFKIAALILKGLSNHSLNNNRSDQAPETEHERLFPGNNIIELTDERKIPQMSKVSKISSTPKGKKANYEDATRKGSSSHNALSNQLHEILSKSLQHKLQSSSTFHALVKNRISPESTSSYINKLLRSVENILHDCLSTVQVLLKAWITAWNAITPETEIKDYIPSIISIVSSVLQTCKHGDAAQSKPEVTMAKAPLANSSQPHEETSSEDTLVEERNIGDVTHPPQDSKNPKTAARIPNDDKIFNQNVSEQQNKPLRGSAVWLFDKTLKYLLPSSKTFSSVFKPGLSSADALALAFSISEILTNTQTLFSSDNAFFFKQALYNVLRETSVVTTTEEFARNFSKAIAEVINKRDLIQNRNPVSLSIEVANKINVGILKEISRQKQSSVVMDENTKEQDNGEASSHTTSLDTASLNQELALTNCKSIIENKQTISKALSDIAEIITNEGIKASPETDLVKMLMEALKVAVTVISPKQKM